MIIFHTGARCTTTARRCSAVREAFNAIKELKQDGQKQEANSPKCSSSGLNINVNGNAIEFKLASSRACRRVVHVETADSENPFA